MKKQYAKIISVSHFQSERSKMIEKKYFVIGVAVTYLVLSVLFFELQDLRYHEFERSCYYDKPCVTFCCKNESLCNQKYIDGHFNASFLPNDEYTGWNGTLGVTAKFGQPNCTLNAADSGKSWKNELVKKNILKPEKEFYL
jgi:hypothetical protein